MTEMARQAPGARAAERGRYVVVRFDFSAFDDKLETLEERFQGYCDIRLRYALERHPDLFPEAALPASQSASGSGYAGLGVA